MYVLSRVAHGHRVVPGLDLETRKDPLLRKVMRLHSPARIWSQPKTSVLQLVERRGSSMVYMLRFEEHAKSPLS